MESFLDRLLADEGTTVRRSTQRTVPPAPSTADGPQHTPEDRPGHGLDQSRFVSDDPRPGAPLPPRDQPLPPPGEPLPPVPLGLGAPRIAVYDTLTSPPRVITVEEEDLPALIASLAEKTYHYCREQGGQVPYSVLQELIENLLHAYFRDVVITILDNGQTIRISDHGPGVDDKERAFHPGFTTATSVQRQIIRGVGSGLPLARESLQFLRGILTVEDNLGGGAVFTIKMPAATEPTIGSGGPPEVRLTTRQTKVLVLLMELGSAGPTAIAKELGFSPATVFRELVVLQDMGLIHSVGDGKRALREEGLRLLESIL